MGWIGLHTSEEKDPHLTMAWWASDKGERRQDAIRLLEDEVFQEVFCQPLLMIVTGEDFFGTHKTVPVLLVRPAWKDKAVFDRLRKIMRRFDRRSATWRPHVTHHHEAAPGSFEFTYLGLHHTNNREPRYYPLGDGA